VTTPSSGVGLGDAGHSAVRVIVEATLDDIRSDDVRLLQEAAGHGSLHVRVPSDALVERATGSRPQFPQAERLFLARAMRWVASAEVVDHSIEEDDAALAARDDPPGVVLVVREEDDRAALRQVADARRVPILVVEQAARTGFPVARQAPLPDERPRAVVTGCYDWLHSGHVRFFMDAAAYGALFVVVGSDRNVELLKGPGHPMQREQERRYMVAAVRSVHAGLVSSGSGWMDAEPEIDVIAPAFYVVNEDGDEPEKRDFCRAHGIEYVVLQRVPHAGLPARSSTDLRGF
jgi:cytidyltransferase-like protein